MQKPERVRVFRVLFESRPLPSEAVWAATVRELWHGAAFREERYAAIDLTGYRLYRSYQRPDVLPLYEEMIVTGAWDFVDEIASRRVGPILRVSRPDDPRDAHLGDGRGPMAPAHGNPVPTGSARCRRS